MVFKFDAATFEMIQNLAYPLIQTLTGFDPAAFVGEQSELFTKVGDGFGEIAELFLLVGVSLEDGKLSEKEIQAIILEAKDIPAAVDTITGFFDDDPLIP